MLSFGNVVDKFIHAYSFHLNWLYLNQNVDECITPLYLILLSRQPFVFVDDCDRESITNSYVEEPKFSGFHYD